MQQRSIVSHTSSTHRHLARVCLVFFFSSIMVSGFELSCKAQEAATVPSVSQNPDPYLALMTRAAAHAKQHGGLYTPALSPARETLLGPSPQVHAAALQAAGFSVVPWTVNDPAAMRSLLDLHVDGIISDRPDLLAAVVKEARSKATGDTKQLAYLSSLDLQGHRGGRGLRPENTLPAFESGLDQGITTIETDTGVTTDHQSLIWHDQFLNPQSCRRANGQPYTLDDRIYIHDISMADAQQQFICDKLHFGADQKNDLSLSPVSVAFAAHENMPSPYGPTSVAQLFRFVAFYADWYRTGGGKSSPDAATRAHTAAHVHFNLETKIIPPGYSEAKVMATATGKTLTAEQASSPAAAENRTVTAEVFVDTLCGFIKAAHMESRADVQSFDFRTLLLVQARFPGIRTYYLTEAASLLNSDFTPAALRSPIDAK